MGKKDKVQVAGIQVQFPDGDSKQLSLDDAQALWKQLDDLFGKGYVPQAPIIIERDRYPWWPHYYVSDARFQPCGSGATSWDTGIPVEKSSTLAVNAPTVFCLEADDSIAT